MMTVGKGVWLWTDRHTNTNEMLSGPKNLTARSMKISEESKFYQNRKAFDHNCTKYPQTATILKREWTQIVSSYSL